MSAALSALVQHALDHGALVLDGGPTERVDVAPLATLPDAERDTDAEWAETMRRLDSETEARLRAVGVVALPDRDDEPENEPP